MLDMQDDIEVLARRARRVLALHGHTSQETDLAQDYEYTDWAEGNLRITLDSRGDELEVMYYRAETLDSAAKTGILERSKAIQVYFESYGSVIHVDEPLIETANQILGRIVVLDELADS